MNIFEQYGIKEVADVTLYSIELDENDDEVYTPVLYLDTLKVSTVEQTASQSSARGGVGNAELIVWDYGKEITVNLEDALYTPASQAMCWGSPISSSSSSTLVLEGQYGTDDEKEDATFYISKISNPVTIIYDKSSNIQVEHYSALVKIITDNGIFYDNIVFVREKINRKYIDAKEYFKDILIGDFNDDGVINQNDCSKLQSLILGNSFSSSEWTAKNRKNISLLNAAANGANNITLASGSLGTSYGESVTLLFNYTIGIIPKDKIIPSFMKGEKIIYLNENSHLQLNNFVVNKIINKNQNKGINDVSLFERMEKCIAKETFCIKTKANQNNYAYSKDKTYSNCELTVFIDPKTMNPYEKNADSYTTKTGNIITGDLTVIKKNTIYYKWTRTIANYGESLGRQLKIDVNHFPGVYKLVGETYARSRKTGKDERYQFEIPLCKMGSENSLTLQAEGEPTTFNMTLKVLRNDFGEMMKLTQYVIDKVSENSNSTKISPTNQLEFNTQYFAVPEVK